MHGQHIIARHTTSTLHAQSRLAKKHSQVSQTATTDTCVTENHSGNARCTMGPNDRNIEYVAAFPYLEQTLHKSFHSRAHRKRKDRPTTKDYKSSMVREWTCPSCIGDVCSCCPLKKPCNARGTKKCSVVLQCAMPLPTMCCWLRQGPPKNG